MLHSESRVHVVRLLLIALAAALFVVWLGVALINLYLGDMSHALQCVGWGAAYVIAFAVIIRLYDLLGRRHAPHHDTAVDAE